LGAQISRESGPVPAWPGLPLDAPPHIPPKDSLFEKGNTKLLRLRLSSISRMQASPEILPVISAAGNGELTKQLFADYSDCSIARTLPGKCALASPTWVTAYAVSKGSMANSN